MSELKSEPCALLLAALIKIGFILFKIKQILVFNYKKTQREIDSIGPLFADDLQSELKSVPCARLFAAFDKNESRFI